MLAGAVAAARASNPALVSPNRPIRVVIAIGVAMSLLAGLSQRELWPFATWALIPGTMPAQVQVRGLVCSNAAGESFAVDHRAWGPLTEEELLSWLAGPYQRLSLPQQDAARAELLAKAEAARVRAAAGRSPAPHPSPLGPLAASSHLMHPALWRRPDRVPVTPCIALRYVARSWNVDSVAAGRGRIAEETLWEYRPAP